MTLLLQSPAFAQQAAGGPPASPLPSWFTEIDATGSGVVSREQFVAHRMRLFDQLDKISPSEWQLVGTTQTNAPAGASQGLQPGVPLK